MVVVATAAGSGTGLVEAVSGVVDFEAALVESEVLAV